MIKTYHDLCKAAARVLEDTPVAEIYRTHGGYLCLIANRVRGGYHSFDWLELMYQQFPSAHARRCTTLCMLMVKADGTYDPVFAEAVRIAKACPPDTEAVRDVRNALDLRLAYLQACLQLPDFDL